MPFIIKGHSRVGLRRTGDVEGVQSVGNWQSRVNQGEPAAWVKRTVVKPVNPTFAKSYYQRRMLFAEHEWIFFNKELKRRAPPLPTIVSIKCVIKNDITHSHIKCYADLYSN